MSKMDKAFERFKSNKIKRQKKTYLEFVKVLMWFAIAFALIASFVEFYFKVQFLSR